MGHRLFPVPSNFPVPGHQVRHSPPAAVKCLSASRPVDMARKITWCLREKKKKKTLWKPKEWTLFGLVYAASQGGHVNGCSGSGGGGTVSHAGKRWRPRVLLMWWRAGGLCVFGGDCEEITPAEVGEAAVPGVIWCHRRPHGCCVSHEPVRGCLSAHPQRTSSANGPLKALSSQSPPTPTLLQKRSWTMFRTSSARRTMKAVRK